MLTGLSHDLREIKKNEYKELLEKFEAMELARINNDPEAFELNELSVAEFDSLHSNGLVNIDGGVDGLYVSLTSVGSYCMGHITWGEATA